ncbi:MAG: hypothetical protein R2751_19025 [Bacteroidales bacterium]
MEVSSGFPNVKGPVTIPAHTTATLLLDQSFLTNAYLTLALKGGKESTVVLTYAESLYDEEGAKDNRNEIEGKSIQGRQDSIFSDGSPHQVFTTLNWRTYRYLEVKVETKGEALVLEDIHGTFTGYPFEKKATFDAGSDEMDRILEIGLADGPPVCGGYLHGLPIL